ncbi:MAG: hypothetical protein K8T10_15515 [Candidatus Eremiobacteraeota bacterium]|nr:hypothetical protein [Candidatus Eremiobacteraeota bacterium]
MRQKKNFLKDRVNQLHHHGDVYYLKGESHRLKGKSRMVREEAVAEKSKENICLEGG